jgi:PEP-CTERM motif
MKPTFCNAAITRFVQTVALLTIIGISSAGSARANPLSYQVTINTSAVTGTSGNLDLQFNPGLLPGTQLATASVQSFSTNGTLGTATLTGDVSGTLPGPLSFDNQTAFNDDFQAMVFGTNIQFDLLLSGPALLAPDGTSVSGSIFGIGLWDSTGINPLLTSDPNGFAGIVNINLDGSGTTSTFLTNTGGPPVVTFTPKVTTIVPEPGSILLFGTGVMAIVGRVRKQFQA